MGSKKHCRQNAACSFLFILLISLFAVLEASEQPVVAAPEAGSVESIAISGNDIFVGGTFTSIGNISANNIARYNRASNTWSPLGGGVNSSVAALAVVGNDLYVGGRFTVATNPGGATVPVTCIVKWNLSTSTWSPLGASGTNNNGVNGDVLAIAASGTNIYIGGGFNLARNTGSNTVSANGVARWNGTSWAALGRDSGAGGNGVFSPGTYQVYSLAVAGSDLYVGGSFTKTQNSNGSSISTNCIAKWNIGAEMWSALGAGQGAKANGVDGDVLAIVVNGTEVYIGGTFTNTFNNLNAGVSSNHVARWNGSTWSALGAGSGPGGNGVDGSVYSLAVGAGVLYVGGDFGTAYNSTGGIGVNGVSANCIARWNGTAWSGLGANGGSTGNGMDGLVSVVSTNLNEVFAGGEFTTAYNSNSNRVTVNSIARWNGTQWSAINSTTGGNGGAVSAVSAASFAGADLAPESIASAFGTGMAAGTQVATSTPLPTSLGGTSITIRDAAGTQRQAPLFFVSPGQINFQIPVGTTAGTATMTVTPTGGAALTGTLQIASVSPAIFTANANGQGVAAATVLRLKGDGTQTFETIARFDAGLNRFVPIPIDIGPNTDQVFLVLFGTGVRGRSSLSAAIASLGGTSTEVLYAGPQGSLVGLDQMNLRIPRSLAGRGEIDVFLTVDGKQTNNIKVSIK